MKTEKAKSQKPKRTLVQIRAEKHALRELIDEGNSILKRLLVVTPHEFLKKSSYGEIVKYKKFLNDCVEVAQKPKDSTNVLKKKHEDVKALIAKIQFYLK